MTVIIVSVSNSWVRRQLAVRIVVSRVVTPRRPPAPARVRTRESLGCLSQEVDHLYNRSGIVDLQCSGSTITSCAASVGGPTQVGAAVWTQREGK